MDDYIIVDDRIIGKQVIYNDRHIGIVTEKVSEGNARIGSEYAVQLENGDTVYITDRSLWKFKVIQS